MKFIKLLFELIKTNIKLKVYKLKTKSYLVTYSAFFKNSSDQIIYSLPMNIVGKITWNIIENLQKQFIEKNPTYQFCSVIGLIKIKTIKINKEVTK